MINYIAASQLYFVRDMIVPNGAAEDCKDSKVLIFCSLIHPSTVIRGNLSQHVRTHSIVYLYVLRRQVSGLPATFIHME